MGLDVILSSKLPGYSEKVQELKESLLNYKKILYPATKLSESIKKINWNHNPCKRLTQWKNKILSTISLCKSHETIMNSKLPKLQHEAKGITYDVYSNVGNTNT